jgi:hypothetical protein
VPGGGLAGWWACGAQERSWDAAPPCVRRNSTAVALVDWCGGWNAQCVWSGPGADARSSTPEVRLCGAGGSRLVGLLVLVGLRRSRALVRRHACVNNNCSTQIRPQTSRAFQSGAQTSKMQLRSACAHGLPCASDGSASPLDQARGGDSHCQTDGDDGDGQGGRFWAEQHRPKGEAPFKRAAGETNFEP